jgi:hypothetical protein
VYTKEDFTPFLGKNVQISCTAMVKAGVVVSVNAIADPEMGGFFIGLKDGYAVWTGDEKFSIHEIKVPE